MADREEEDLRRSRCPSHPLASVTGGDPDLYLDRGPTGGLQPGQDPGPVQEALQEERSAELKP